MQTLDGGFEQKKEADVAFFPTAIRWGLIGGVISVAYTLMGILTGISDPSAGPIKMMLSSFGLIAIYIGTIVFVIRSHRDQELGGYISIGRAFLVGLIASVITTLMANVFSYIYVEFIDPSYLDKMIEGMEEMIVGFDMPEEMLEGMMEETRNQFKLSTIFTSGLIYATAVNAVISIICAAVMKKEVPPTV